VTSERHFGWSCLAFTLHACREVRSRIEPMGRATAAADGVEMKPERICKSAINLNQEISRDERETLWMELPRIHIACMGLLSNVVSTLAKHALFRYRRSVHRHQRTKQTIDCRTQVSIKPFALVFNSTRKSAVTSERHFGWSCLAFTLHAWACFPTLSDHRLPNAGLY
jgi:hypothetical protein